MFQKKVLNIFSIIIGLVFIISGFSKIIDTGGFSDLIYQYGLGYLRHLSPIIILFEILLGLYLTLLINPKKYSMISCVLLILFSIAYVFAHFFYGIDDCGCFGDLIKPKNPFIFTVVRNAFLIGLTLILWIKYPKMEIEPAKWKIVIILTIMFFSSFLAGLTLKSPLFVKHQHESHKFQNQHIEKTELSHYIKTSPNSKYLIFCFSYTCPHCLNSIENLRQYQKSETIDSLIVFAVGENKDKLIFEENFKPDFKINHITSEEMDKLTNAYPTSFYVERDTVKVIIQAVLPSPFVFNKTYINEPNKPK